MRYGRHSPISNGLVLTCGALVLFLLACSSNAGAQLPPREPTAQVQPGFQPGQATPAQDIKPRATFVPGDPNQPVSNETPVTPAKQNSSQTRITGRVTNAAGEPIARARLAFTDSSVPMPEIAYTTNANGEYGMTVPRGEYTLVVNADGYASQQRKIDSRQEAQMRSDFVLQAQ
jgi:hypothetical protein